MTKLLYLENAYIQQFKATVLEQLESAVVLDKSAFYPGGGGQPSDNGRLSTESDSWPVTRVKRVGSKLAHYIEGDLPDVGLEVSGQLDWDRRYNLMRIHTALHVLCGVVWRDYRASVTGGNMEPLKGRMDFEFETMKQELVAQIEETVNQEAAQGRSVVAKILPRDEAFKIPDLIRTKINLLPEGIQEVRTVEIVGLDLQADGGTHVKNTSEVGQIRVVNYKSKGRINKRIYIELDE
jgi:misacylated tRNA(Ala) deacylase